MPANKTIFEQHANNKIFIETGSYIGNGIRSAIDAGFEKIYSIELSKFHANQCRERFVENKNVSIIEGDSSKILWNLIKEIEQPITFWLDGHWSAGNTALGDEISPLLKELDISNHNLKNHTILIDDMRCWKKDNPLIQFGIDDILNKIFDINQNYQITYYDGEKKDDILAAFIQ